jgi:hypothetical protein
MKLSASRLSYINARVSWTKPPAKIFVFKVSWPGLEVNVTASNKP